MAPRRASASTSTLLSSQVGSCHDTTSPAPIPWRASPAAARSAAVLASAHVRVRPSSSTAASPSGVAAARRSTSSQRLPPSTFGMCTTPCARPDDPSDTRQAPAAPVDGRRTLTAPVRMTSLRCRAWSWRGGASRTAAGPSPCWSAARRPSRVVLDRRRVQLCPDALPRQAYHAAQGLPRARAAALVAEVDAAVATMTAAVLGELAAVAAEHGDLVAAGGGGPSRASSPTSARCWATTRCCTQPRASCTAPPSTTRRRRTGSPSVRRRRSAPSTKRPPRWARAGTRSRPA